VSILISYNLKNEPIAKLDNKPLLVSTGGTPRSKSGSHQLHLLELKVSIMPKQSHVFVSSVRLMSLLTAVIHHKAHGTLTPWIGWSTLHPLGFTSRHYLQLSTLLTHEWKSIFDWEYTDRE
jgi:hypothetical protein